MRISRNGCHWLALLPLVYLIWMVAQYGVAVPFWDQWELVPLLEKSYQGRLTFHDLWEQHNEHRIVFPQLIMLGMARLTRWNIAYELALNVALAIAIFAVLTWQIRRTARDLNVAGLRWAIPACSLIVFSVSQFQNWLWGWQMQMFLNVLATVGGLLLLASRPFRWLKFAGSGMLGVVATYSFANGLLFWPIGLLVLLSATVGRERKSSAAAWTLLSGLTLWSYFWHYQTPLDRPSLLLLFHEPSEYARYVLKYLGALCAEHAKFGATGASGLALVCGSIALVALCWSGWMLRRRKLADLNALLPYLGISLYSIGGALLTGVGRIGFGSDQALSSRYCTMAAPLWVSLVVFLFLLVKGRGKAAGVQRVEKTPGRWEILREPRTVARWLLIAVIVLLGQSSFLAKGVMKTVSELQALGRTQLAELAARPNAQADYSRLFVLYPRLNVLLERYPVLVKHRLSIFRDMKP